MQLKHIAAAVALVVGSSAYAVGPGSLGSIDNLAVSIGNTVGAGTLVDLYSFSLVDPGTVSGSAFAFSLPPLYTTLGFQVQLIDTSFNVLGTDLNPADGFSFSGLSSGSYALQFAGYSTGNLGGAYAGVVSATTAPVPEPETYAMMLAGLCAVGFVATRRRTRG
jgi:hypothetical protein